MGMSQLGKTLLTVADHSKITKDCVHYDNEWYEHRIIIIETSEGIDAEVSRLVNGGTTVALRNTKRWRNSTSSGYSSHSPPLSAGSYSTCCAGSVVRNSTLGTVVGGAGAQQVGLTGSETTTLTGGGVGNLAVIHETEAIPRPIWPYRDDQNGINFIGCSRLDCEAATLSASCSYTHSAYTYASCCRNAYKDNQTYVPTARDILVELTKTLNSAINSDSGMTPEQILSDISRTVTKGIEANAAAATATTTTTTTTISTGLSDEQIYKLSSSSSSSLSLAGKDSFVCKESLVANPVNFQLYSKTKSSTNPSNHHQQQQQQQIHNEKLNVKSSFKHSNVPAVFLLPTSNQIYSNTLLPSGNNHFQFSDHQFSQLKPASQKDPSNNCFNGEPVYLAQLDPSDESSTSYGAVGEPQNEKNSWNQGISVFKKSLDFTLDGARAERLRRNIARAKRRRQWCRALTALLGLVFFVLSVVIVSMSVTRGRKIFGSM